MGAPLEFITSDYEPCIPDSSATVASVSATCIPTVSGRVETVAMGLPSAHIERMKIEFALNFHSRSHVSGKKGHQL